MYGLLARAAVKKAADRRTTVQPQRSSGHTPGQYSVAYRRAACVASGSPLRLIITAPRVQYRVGVPLNLPSRGLQNSPPPLRPPRCRADEREGATLGAVERESERTLRVSRRSITWPRFVSPPSNFSSRFLPVVRVRVRCGSHETPNSRPLQLVL